MWADGHLERMRVNINRQGVDGIHFEDLQVLKDYLVTGFLEMMMMQPPGNQDVYDNVLNGICTYLVEEQTFIDLYDAIHDAIVESDYDKFNEFMETVHKYGQAFKKGPHPQI